MLTDDDLTRQLGDAFRGASDDLGYGGRVPTARRTPAWATAATLALPVAAAATVGAIALAGGPGATAPRSDVPSAGAAPTTTVTTTGTPATSGAPADTVTETIDLAGLSFSYERGVHDDPLLVSIDVARVPEWAEPVDMPDDVAAKAWVGTDPGTGDAVVFLEAPTRNGGLLMSLTSGDLGESAMVDLLLGRG